MEHSSGSMEITTVIGCRLRCRSCGQDKLVKKYSQRTAGADLYFTLEDFKKYVDKIPADVSIVFSGMSEPWLNEECTGMVEYASGKGHRIMIRTTLTGVKKDDLQRIAQLDGLGEFVVQLPNDSPGGRIPVTGEYLRLLSYILDGNGSLRGRVRFECCGSGVDPALSEYAGEAAKRGIFRLFDDSALPEDGGDGGFLNAAIECSLSARSLNNNVLLPDGSVLLCFMDFGMEHLLGSLREKEYRELFLSPEAHRVLGAFDDGSIPLLCRSCPLAKKYDGRMVCG